MASGSDRFGGGGTGGDGVDGQRADADGPGGDAPAITRGRDAEAEPGADPDAQLMLAFQAGNASAFDALFRRWSAPVHRHLERIVRDAGRAEELLQEAFLRVFRARERYAPQARFSTWLFTIATNLALNELRRPHHRAPHRSTEEDDDERAPLALASGGPPADEIVDARRVGADVEQALAELPERQRAALLLAAVEGLSYAEVAEALGTSEKSVKALVHRARVALAERMQARPPRGARGEET